MRHLPNTRHARKLKAEVFNCKRLRQTEDQRAPQMRAGGFMFTPPKHDIFVVQSVGELSDAQFMLYAGCRIHSPDVEVLGAARTPATTKEAEGHGL
jgi:hypothetical protein